MTNQNLKQLQQSQKMATLGRLTGGIAHEINNLLTVIMWNLDLMTRSLPGSSKDFDRAHIALSAALNGTDLLRQLMAFARAGTGEARAIELGEFLPRAAKLLRPVLGAEIAVELKMADDLWPVFADSTRLELALVNLAIHARDAMPDGGNLAIVAANQPAAGDLRSDGVALTLTGRRQGETAASEPAADDALAMVKSFAADAGGKLMVEKAPAGGTRIRLLVPRAEAPQPAKSAPGGDTAGIILVVEDDADVRQVTVARLSEFGQRVIEAADAREALDILAKRPDIDLLFTDIALPGGMNGLELARQARKLRPDLRVLFVSGYASSLHSSAGTPGEFLQKPYRRDELGNALKRVLDARDEAAADGPTA